MDSTELTQKLENFKQACIEQGYIETDKEAFIIEESFPGLKPSSFFVYVNAKKQWLKDKPPRTALNELDELLYKTVDEQALENILAIRLGHTYPSEDRKAA